MTRGLDGYGVLLIVHSMFAPSNEEKHDEGAPILATSYTVYMQRYHLLLCSCSLFYIRGDGGNNVSWHTGFLFAVDILSDCSWYAIQLFATLATSLFCPNNQSSPRTKNTSTFLNSAKQRVLVLTMSKVHHHQHRIAHGSPLQEIPLRTSTNGEHNHGSSACSW